MNIRKAEANQSAERLEKRSHDALEKISENVLNSMIGIASSKRVHV